MGSGSQDAYKMDGRQFQETVVKVLPSYPEKYSKLLGIAQIVTGVVVLAFSIAVFATKAFTSVGGSGVLLFVGIAACGGVGILAARKKEVWTVSVFFILSVVCIVFGITLLAASITAFQYEKDRDREHHSSVREGLDACMIGISLIATSATAGSLVICSHALFYGVCKKSSGVQYVQDSVAYNPNMTESEAQPTSVSNGGADLPPAMQVTLQTLS